MRASPVPGQTQRPIPTCHGYPRVTLGLSQRRFAFRANLARLRLPSSAGLLPRVDCAALILRRYLGGFRRRMELTASTTRGHVAVSRFLSHVINSFLVTMFVF